MADGKMRSVELTPDIDRAIAQRLETGAYASEVDVIRAGLRALDRDEETARHLATLDASITRGIADADAGRIHSSDKVFGELRERIRKAGPDRR